MIGMFYEWLMSSSGESGVAEHVFNNMSTTILPGTTPSAAAGNPATEAASASALRWALTVQHLKNFGGILTYMTSKWALACLTLVCHIDRPSSCIATPEQSLERLPSSSYRLLDAPRCD